MKIFVDPYAGIEFGNIKDAVDDFCKYVRERNNCGSRCPIGKRTFQDCLTWAKKHPDEAADIMCLDIVEVETPSEGEAAGNG